MKRLYLRNIISFFIAINEFLTLDLIQKSLTNGCHVVKFWTLMTGSISQTLLVFNSSINFLMYPAFSKDFRSVCKECINSKLVFSNKIWTLCKKSTSSDTNGVDEVELESYPHSVHRSLPAFVNVDVQSPIDISNILAEKTSNYEDKDASKKEEYIIDTRTSDTSSILSNSGLSSLSNH